MVNTLEKKEKELTEKQEKKVEEVKKESKKAVAEAKQKIKVANLDEIDILVTELDPDDPTLLPFKHKGLTIY